jgi:hypothetical protein
MNRKITLFACLALVVGVFLASCNDAGENGRAVVTVSSMNGNAPFFSDVLEQGDSLFFPPGGPLAGLPLTLDDFVGEDWVPVTFYNRPYNDFATTGPGKPFNDFLVTGYHVTWRRVDGGVGIPPAYTGATNINVPSGKEIGALILLVPYEVKNTPLMTAINYNNPPPGGAFPDEYLMIAHVEFTGHEVGTDRDQTFSAEVSVNFADPVVVTERN